MPTEVVSSQEDRDVVRRILLGYILAWVLEGALRKWFFTPIQEVIYFVRVPFVLAAAFYSLQRLPPKIPTPALAGMLAILGITCFSCLHVIHGDQTLIQALLGSRLTIELFLMPLALAPWLRPPHALAAYRLIVGMTFPVALLAVAQVLSPASSPVNKLLADGGEDNFTNVGGVVRATGMFTSSSGHVGFVLMAVASALALSLSENKSATDKMMLIGAFPLLPILILSSGSRSAIFGAGFILLISLPIIGVHRPTVLPRLALGALAVSYAAWKIAPILTPDAIYALMTRLAGAGMQQEAGTRTLDSFTTWTKIVPLAPSFGIGLGSTAQGLGAVDLSNTSVHTEAELEQWVMQLGPVLFAFALLLRISAIIYLVKTTLSAAVRGHIAAAPVLAAGLWAWLVGTTTNQGSVNGYAVLAALLVLCYRKQQKNKIGASQELVHNHGH